MRDLKVAAVLPAYKSRAQILEVLENIGTEVEEIFVVDDACPMATGPLLLYYFSCVPPPFNVFVSE